MDRTASRPWECPTVCHPLQAPAQPATMMMVPGMELGALLGMGVVVAGLVRVQQRVRRPQGRHPGGAVVVVVVVVAQASRPRPSRTSPWCRRATWTCTPSRRLSSI